MRETQIMTADERGGVIGWLDRAVRPGWVMPALLLLTVALRTLWCIVREAGITGEAFNVASTLARTGQFSDAFGAGTGPTAHLPPIGPAIAAAVYSLFGIDTVAANFVLAAYAIALVVTSYALGRALFHRLGAPRLAQAIALFSLAILPIYLGVETAENRVWETGLSVVGYIGFLLILVRLEPARAIGWGAIIGVTVLAALLFFVNPIIGISCYIIAGIFILRHFTIGRSVAIVGVALVIWAAVLTPWAIRNQEVMHAFIPLRSNMGLEMALANFPEAVGAKDPGAAFAARFFEIHPTTEQGRKQFDLQGGEVAYSNRLKQDTLAWIVANPIGYARLAVSHFFQFILPRPWHFTFGFGTNPEVEMRAGLANVIGFIGFAGVLIALFFRSWSYRYVALAVLLPALGYASFQPSLRYVYLVYALQTFFAADLVVRLVTRRMWDTRTPDAGS